MATASSRSSNRKYAITEVTAEVHPCELCGFFATDRLCEICADESRDPAIICVVENPTDILPIERTGVFRGRYHTLGGRLSPLDGIGPEDLGVQQLVDRVTAGGVREVILATNPSLEGEATALYVQRQVGPHVAVVSRIARGIPVGGDLEYAYGVTIAQAISARREM